MQAGAGPQARARATRSGGQEPVSERRMVDQASSTVLSE